MALKQNLQNFRSRASLAWLGVPLLLGLLADLWTKHLAVAQLAPPEPDLPAADYAFIPGWLHFTYVSNRGAVFGLGDGYRWLFVTVSLAAIVAVLVMFAASQRRRLYQVLLGMLLAGIIGNLYDRLAYGHVRDMIHALPRWPHFFPWVFNVADSLLCVSIGALILYGLIFPDPRAHEPSDHPA